MKSLKKMVLSALLATTMLSSVGFNVHAQETTTGSITENTHIANEERANDEAYSEEAITAEDGIDFDDEGNITAVTIGGETAEVTQENPANPETPVNNSPNRITTNLTDDPSTLMHFQSHTTDADENAKLYIWEDGQSMDDAAEVDPEIIEIDDAFYNQMTEDGHYVYAIMWDEEEE